MKQATSNLQKKNSVKNRLNKKERAKKVFVLMFCAADLWRSTNSHTTSHLTIQS